MASGDFSWIKFGILFVPFTLAMFVFAPSIKWKFLLTMAGAVGIYMALIGKTSKGVTPMGRSW